MPYPRHAQQGDHPQRATGALVPRAAVPGRGSGDGLNVAMAGSAAAGGGPRLSADDFWQRLGL